jgi:RHS repeat-associated protein
VTGRNNTFITGASKPIGVAVDASYVYWTNFNSGTIGRAAKAGSGVNQSFIVSGAYPWSVEVRGAYVYWSNYLLGSGASGDKIGRADVGGTNVNTAFVTGASGPRGIVTDGTYLYWANHTPNTVGRSLLNGTGVSQSFVVSASTATADLLRPAGLAVTGSHVLWSNSDVPKVGRAVLTGVVDQLTIFLDGQEIVNNPGSATVVSAARYYSGSGLLATRSTVGGLTFVGTDSQGTLTATLTTTGTFTRQRYKPFGEQRGAANQLPSERGFIGQVEDTAAGLSYLNARHYDATNATFLGVDPVLRLTEPESLNAYIYAGNSPIVLSDPTGLCAECGMVDWDQVAKSNPKAIEAILGGGGSSNAKPDPYVPKNAIAPGSVFYGQEFERQGNLLTEDGWYDIASERADCISGLCTITSKVVKRFRGVLYDYLNGYEYDATLELETIRTWTFVGLFLDYQKGLPSVLPAHGLVSETRQLITILVGKARRMVFEDPMNTTIPSRTPKISLPEDKPIFRNDTKHSLKAGQRFRPAPYDKRYRPGGSLYEAY